MKLILLDGGTASGKNTLGAFLVDQYKKENIRALLLDLDVYVEEINPTWIWKDDLQKEKDQLVARINFVKDNCGIIPVSICFVNSMPFI